MRAIADAEAATASRATGALPADPLSRRSRSAHATTCALVAAVLLLLAPAPSRASARAALQQGNVLRGKVQYAPGRPAVNVIIVIESGSGIPVGQITTSTEGDFLFNGLNESTYIISIREPDYQPVREEVNFAVHPDADQPGESRFVTIQLVPLSTVRSGPGGTVFAQNVPPAARAAYDRGLKLAKEKDHAGAIVACREAVQLFPEYFDAHYTLGVELMESGAVDESLRELEQARSINPKDARVYATFGQLLARQHKFAIAAAAFGEAARLDPSEPQFPLQRAAVLVDRASTLDARKADEAKVRTELLDEASRDLDTAWSRSGKSLAAVHLQRARLWERRGDRKAAANSLEAYLALSPNAPNADAIRRSIETLRTGN